MSDLTFAQATYMAAAAVALAVMSPRDWHDIALDAARQRYGVGPGGTATEEEDDNTEESNNE